MPFLITTLSATDIPALKQARGMSRFACSLVPYGFAFRRQGPYLTTDTLIHINALHTVEYKYVQVEV